MENNLNNEQPRLIIVGGPTTAAKTALVASLKEGNLQPITHFNANAYFDQHFNESVGHMSVGNAFFLSNVHMEMKLFDSIAESIKKREHFLLEASFEKPPLSRYIYEFTKAGYHTEYNFICPDHVIERQLPIPPNRLIDKLGDPIPDLKIVFADNLHRINQCWISVNRLNLYDGTPAKILATVADREVVFSDPLALKKEWIQHMPTLADRINTHLALQQRQNVSTLANAIAKYRAVDQKKVKGTKL